MEHTSLSTAELRSPAETETARAREPLASRAPQSLFKRPLDVFLAVVGLVLSAPIWLAVALSIKLSDRGPVLYRQERWGLEGKRIQVLKFRTMVAHSDEAFGIRQAAADDHRVIGWVGRLLRATGLDELPQLVNILRGDMSFVGPRPLAVEESLSDGNGGVISYHDVAGFSERMSVRPGLTGTATVYLPKDASPEHKLEEDLRYVREHTFALDLKLIVLSLWISVRGRWEARGPKL